MLLVMLLWKSGNHLGSGLGWSESLGVGTNTEKKTTWPPGYFQTNLMNFLHVSLEPTTTTTKNH